MGKIYLSGLYIYPIKSIAGISLKESFAGERGLEYDRRWMLIDENNNFITQRQYHSMALIDLTLDGENIVLAHRSKNISEIKIPLEIQNGSPIQSTLWNDQVKVIWPNLFADGWFSEVLNIKCRLVYLPDDSKRQIDPDYVQQAMNTSLSDGYPYLLAGTKSLDDIREKTRIDLEMKRFRPNLVVKTQSAFDEDSWKKLRIGDLVFEVVKPCARCVMTTIDPETGKAGKEPLKTLATYRKQNGKVLFGQNVIIKSEGVIRVGDEIKIVE